ncbi:VPLPA-CTERM sorting domain-containing protein [Marimonas sp. MJW-29]|uniref:VPLPA-CTERM sorting domain-containing protein n=1 Tax=Sulfitobacter sediminis TaxID=3234186 RepID=A0ABV3RN26_9RHOB
MYVRAKGLVLAALAMAGSFLCASVASAATLSFTLDDQQGAVSMRTDVVITDIVGGVNMAFAINDPSRTPPNDGDVIAVYFNLLPPFTYSDLTIANIGPVTGSAGNTSNIQGGNIGQTFNVGVAIGTTGEGSGDVYAAFDFDVLGSASGVDLTIAAFFNQTFAARGGSIGLGEDSAKQFGTAGSGGDGQTPIPLPAAGWMLISGLAGLFALRRRRKAA